jgi:acyl-CoA synthetase (AMP-forming)/AMP-acid ligase II
VQLNGSLMNWARELSTSHVRKAHLPHKDPHCEVQLRPGPRTRGHRRLGGIRGARVPPQCPYAICFEGAWRAMIAGEFVDLVNPPERVAKYREVGWWTDETLAAMVNFHADLNPSSVAVVDELGGSRHTYAELRRHAASLAQSLAALGVRVGETVSVQLPNAYHAVVAAVAVQSLGAVLNPLLPNYRTRELLHAVTTTESGVVITPGTYHGWDYVPMIDEVCKLSGVDVIHLVDDDSAADDVSIGALIAANPDPERLREVKSAVSEVIFTSGTESTPKAIMHSEENANCAVRTLFKDLGSSENRAVWMPSPVGHSTGFNFGIRAALYHGLPLILQDRWSASDAIELLQRFGGTYTLAATTFLSDLVDECERTGVRLPRMREFGCGGAPVAPDLVRRADAVGIQVLRLYGSTEVLCATWNRPTSTLEQRAHTDGLPLSNTEIQIRDDVGRPMPVDTEGEVYVRGPQASVGFFADPERTAATYLPDGWIRTGDLATVDDDGYLTIVGRKKEIIIRGGVNIAPREIEEMLLQFAEVERASVVGVHDPRLGERTCACVVFSPGRKLDLGQIVARLRDAGLATYKLPERLHVMETLPMTSSGKVQKHVIVEDLNRLQHDIAVAGGD